MRQYARQIDQALRPLLNGVDVPLILAATEPLDSIYRSVSTYPQLAPTTIAGNPEATSDTDLVAGARVVLDELYASELEAIHELYRRRASEHRAAADIVDVARAATFGAVDTVLVDIDEVVPGVVDEETGAVTFAEDERRGQLRRRRRDRAPGLAHRRTRARGAARRISRPAARSRRSSATRSSEQRLPPGALASRPLA